MCFSGSDWQSNGYRSTEGRLKNHWRNHCKITAFFWADEIWKLYFYLNNAKERDGCRPAGEKSIKNLRVRAPDGALGTGVALRARNLSKSFQNQTESARYAWKDSANRGQSSLLELLRCSLSYGKIVQTEGNQACLNCWGAAYLMEIIQNSIQN